MIDTQVFGNGVDGCIRASVGWVTVHAFIGWWAAWVCHCGLVWDVLGWEQGGLEGYFRWMDDGWMGGHTDFVYMTGRKIAERRMNAWRWGGGDSRRPSVSTTFTSLTRAVLQVTSLADDGLLQDSDMSRCLRIHGMESREEEGR